MPVNDTTTNQGYEKPNIANTLAYDVGRLRSALDAIDVDVAARALSTPIAVNDQVVSSNYTLGTAKHGVSVGPVEIGASATVTLNQATWMIL